MTHQFQNIFSDDYINYLIQLPEVIVAKNKLNTEK